MDATDKKTVGELMDRDARAALDDDDYQAVAAAIRLGGEKAMLFAKDDRIASMLEAIDDIELASWHEYLWGKEGVN